MMQETGGQAKYLNDPNTYHYEPDANGVRKSSARGPFGILESTGRDPGYGVKPMQGNSLEENIRFSSDYLGARVKREGLQNGIGGYGSGKDTSYASEVLGRIAKAPAGGNPVAAVENIAPVAPIVVAQTAPATAPVVPAPPVERATEGPDQWQQFLARSQADMVKPADLNYGPVEPVTAGVVTPNFQAAANYAGQNQEPNLHVMAGFKGLGLKARG